MGLALALGMQYIGNMKTIRNYGGETVGSVVHAFELAGLGKAPFRFDGFEVKTYQAAPDAPVQPGTCCDYCFTGISNVCWIKSVDGKRFKVGCDCAEKTGDRGLCKFIDAKVAEHRRMLAAKRADAKIEAARALLPAVSESLKAKPHPQADRGGFFANLTMLDYVMWMLSNAGTKGQLAASKIITNEAKS